MGAAELVLWVGGRFHEYLVRAGGGPRGPQPRGRGGVGAQDVWYFKFFLYPISFGGYYARQTDVWVWLPRVPYHGWGATKFSVVVHTCYNGGGYMRGQLGNN